MPNIGQTEKSTDNNNEKMPNIGQTEKSTDNNN